MKRSNIAGHSPVPLPVPEHIEITTVLLLQSGWAHMTVFSHPKLGEKYVNYVWLCSIKTVRQYSPFHFPLRSELRGQWFKIPCSEDERTLGSRVIIWKMSLQRKLLHSHWIGTGWRDKPVCETSEAISTTEIHCSNTEEISSRNEMLT